MSIADLIAEADDYAQRGWGDISDFAARVSKALKRRASRKPKTATSDDAPWGAGLVAPSGSYGPPATGDRDAVQDAVKQSFETAPSDTERPDDTEADAAIAEAEDLTEALWEIAAKYEVPVTNNYSRWQDGQWLRQIGEFIGDIQKAVERFGPSQPVQVEVTDMDYLFNDPNPQRVRVEVTDDMVTRAYRAQHIAEWGDDLDPNDIGTPNDREAMRSALVAALSGGDHAK